MNQNSNPHQNRIPYSEGLITALAVGGFLIILGVVFALTPGTWQTVDTFFNDLTTVYYQIGTSSSTVNLLAPLHPDVHAGFYVAVQSFCIGIGVLQVIILALRLYVRSAVRRIAETVGNMVFWFGAAVSVSIFLMAGTLTGWFQFWAALLLILGVSLIARGLVYLFRGPLKRRTNVA
jgi:hypothetical protein